jgi:hypothetical protein
MKNVNSVLRSHPIRLAVVVVLVAVAAFAIYRFTSGNDAQAQGAPAATPVAVATVSTAVGAAGNGSCCTLPQKGGAATATGATAAGSCCAGPATAAGTSTQGTAQLTGDVQKISVDLSTGVYDPDVINLKAGVPAEITFGQSSGCTGIVQSQDLGFQADLTGGPQTVKLAGLQPGTYGFACGMNMVKGKIVVK